MPQTKLAIWARRNAEKFLNRLDIGNLNLQLEILKTTSKTLEERVSGQLSAYELRQAGFLANSLSKESRTEVSRLAAKIYAQAIATGHMRGHAIVSSDYAIKLINIEHPKNPEKVIEERQAQIALAKSMIIETP